MASEIGICNLALSHFGQAANISSISPPEGSPDAEHCATFYPIARDALLEMWDWPFAKKRATLAQLAIGTSPWLYRYALPADCIKPRSINVAGAAVNAETDGFIWEGPELFSNAPAAILSYTFRLTDPTKFTPLFTQALSLLLASYIIGPITKDMTGKSQALMWQRFMASYGLATVSAANVGANRASHLPASIRAR
jgi:hypothetical protein